MESKVKLPDCWMSVLGDEFTKPYMQDIRKFLATELSKKKVIYPPIDSIFEALTSTPFSKVKIIVLGQDPYHGYGQAHGLSFSVNSSMPIPPSLRNIFKEVLANYPNSTFRNGNLASWAEQGVLLLNSSLTVEANKPNSHQNIGWNFFTDAVIKCCSQSGKKVFMLWGRHAREKIKLINSENNLVLEAAHPSPLSAHQGFIGCNHFLKANQYLEEQKLSKINWDVN